MSEKQHTTRCWALLWHSRQSGALLIRKGYLPMLFRTREEAREWRDRHYGYIRHRRDLRDPPHNWRLPRPVRVTITVEEWQ